MTHRLLIATALFVAWTQAPAHGGGAEPALPSRDGRPAVAVVNGDPISLDELVLQLDPPVDTKRLLEGRATASEIELLDRLIIVRLLVQEAAAMGLGDIPEIRKQVDVTSRTVLREVLMEHLVKDLQPDPAAVEQQFKELARQFRTESLLFTDEAAAKQARAELDAGGDYAAVAARAVAEKKARTEGDDEYHAAKDYLPPVAAAVAALAPGQASAVVRIDAGFVIVRLVDVRYPESEEVRAAARAAVLAQQRQKFLDAHEEALRKQYVVIHQDVVDSLDYEAREPGIDALLQDTRVLADIKGGSPLTVADFTDYLKMQFFHGGDAEGQAKRMNSRKAAALEATLARRVMNVEAAQLGIDKSPAYLDRINGFEESLVFEAFVQKVIAPDARVSEPEARRYYDQHLREFSSPEMFRIRSLAFTTRAAAEDATRKLREGADYGWLASNADGQVDPKTEGVLSFDGRPLTRDSMPEGLQQALAGARAGETRLYASPEGHFYALAVQDVIAPDARPYDAVRGEIAKTLYGENLKRLVEDYAARLRARGTVEIYLKRAQ